MNLFNNIIETFENKKTEEKKPEEKKPEEKKPEEKKQDYLPHIFLIIVLLICIILGVVYMDKIMDVWNGLTGYKPLYNENGQSIL